jgi:hypothetical protein
MQQPLTAGVRAAGRSQLVTILVLFVTLRLTVLFFFAPHGPLYRYTDFEFYYRTAQLAERGRFPFVNMWYEYPPLMAYLPHAVYAAAGAFAAPGAPAHFSAFSHLFSLVLLACDAGSLALLHRVGRRAWGVERADWLGWVYSGLSLPLVLLTYVHMGPAVFCLLLALAWFVDGRERLSAAALGLGVAARLLPVFWLAAAARFLWPAQRRTAAYTAITLGVFALTYLPFLLLGGGAWIAASFRAWAGAGSYATLWALVDSNWGPGYYGPLEARLSLAGAVQTYANPAVIPAWLALALFGGLYAAFFFRPLDRRDPRALLRFSALAAALFHLWLKGWSPQYALAVLPLALLAFPDWRGLAAALLLSATSTTHWTGSQPAMAALILARAAIFIGLILLLSRALWPAAARAGAPAQVPVTGGDTPDHGA